MQINEQKSALRKEYRAKRAEIRAEELERSSILICESISSLPEYKNAEQIFLYFPVKGEASPLPLFQIALKDGKKVGFPKSDTKNFTLDFYRVTDENDFSVGAYSIPEPKTDAEKLIPNEKTLCVVPALLFSRDLHRLGYGKGFYDRFLASFNGKSVGFAMSNFILDTIPSEKTDTRLDIIAHEKGAIRREE